IIKSLPIKDFVAAVSCGISREGELLLDLNYDEDCSAATDANFVIAEKLGIIEIQGTAEGQPFAKAQFMRLLEMAELGTSELIGLARKALLGVK
ncbi:MAG: ribonuclease PH, partial [Alphaproteobacteria bacterium]|nr:ribonuclease PH [Alphaproteobacteria bacterium]